MIPEVVWSVVWGTGIVVFLTILFIAYILRIAYLETQDEQVPQQKVQEGTKAVETESR